MEFEQAVTTANAVLQSQVGRSLNDLEIELLRGAWDSLKYEEISSRSGYSLNYLQRDAGPKLWKLLSDSFGRKLNKTNARAILTQKAQEPSAQASQPIRTYEPPSPSKSLARRPYVDWEEAIDVSIFYGRESELDMLSRWILGDRALENPGQRCRLVALLGMGGMGKSSLAAKIADQVKDQFEFVVWRSLRNAPPLTNLLKELVPLLSHQQEVQATPDRLLHWLRRSRCLIILDNAETIMQPGGRAGYYPPDYGDYGDLLRAIGESSHQSCVILTSREKPAEVSMMETTSAWVRSLTLKGSRQAALALVEDKGLTGTPAEKARLCEHYGCSPLALKIAAATIHSLFSGDIAAFLAQETLIFSGLRRLLDEQCERLALLERSIMCWLAINREWTTIDELLNDVVPPVPRLNLLEALESLSWRSLIEVRSGRYTQQPIVMEYILDSFIHQLVEEIVSGQFGLLGEYALLKTTAKNYIQGTQRRLILAPIAAQMRSRLSEVEIFQCLRHGLDQVRYQRPAPWVYGAGNILNLAHHLQLDLAAWDFSGLTVQYADLRDTALHRLSFAQAHLVHPRFAEVFSVVFCVAFSPDGALLAAGDIDRTISVWRVDDGSKVLSLRGHGNWVWAIAFSPKMPLLASAGEDYAVRVWAIDTGQCLHCLQGHADAVVSVVFAPNGRTLASGSHDGSVKVWDAATGALLQTLEANQDRIWSVAFSPDGQEVASVGADQRVVVWSVATATPRHAWRAHEGSIRAVAYSPDGNTLATASEDRTICLWNAATGQCRHTLRRHTDEVRSVAFSPDGALVVSGSADHTIRLWQTETGRLLRTLHGHRDWVRAVAFSPQGSTLASGGQDQTVKLWDGDTGQILRSLRGHSSQIRAIAFSPDGQTLASGGDNRAVKLWNMASGTMEKALRGHTNQVRAVAFAPLPPALKSSLGHLVDRISTVQGAFQRPCPILASSSMDHTIRLWDTVSGQTLQTLTEANERIRTVAFSPNQPLLASGGENQDVRLWDVVQGQVVRVLKGHTNRIMSVAFSPDGILLASGSDDRTIRLWDVTTGELSDVLEGHQHWVWAIAFSPDGATLASSSADHTVRLWDPKSGEMKTILRGHEAAVIALAYRPDGSRLASSSPDGTIRIWSSGGECLQILNADTQWVRAIAFSPDGSLLASGEENELIKIWDVDSGQCLRRLRGDRPYEGMDITGVRGLTEAQKATLKLLGAVDQ